jgi:Skp family chaperone for outer membrane proteins
LEALEAIRRAAKAKKKSKGVTVDNIKIELQAEQLRSREFANQYNEQVKLTEALSRRVDELEQALSRAKRDLSKIQPLRGIGQHGR